MKNTSLILSVISLIAVVVFGVLTLTKGGKQAEPATEEAATEAAQKGDSIEQKVDMREFEQMVYPIHFHVESVNKDQLLLAIVSLVSGTMALSLGNLQSTIEDDIVSTDFEVFVHSHNEIKQLKDAISSLPHVYGMRTY